MILNKNVINELLTNTQSMHQSIWDSEIEIEESGKNSKFLIFSSRNWKNLIWSYFIRYIDIYVNHSLKYFQETFNNTFETIPNIFNLEKVRVKNYNTSDGTLLNEIRFVEKIAENKVTLIVKNGFALFILFVKELRDGNSKSNQ